MAWLSQVRVEQEKLLSVHEYVLARAATKLSQLVAHVPSETEATDAAARSPRNVCHSASEACFDSTSEGVTPNVVAT